MLIANCIIISDCHNSSGDPNELIKLWASESKKSEEDVLAQQEIAPDDVDALVDTTDALMEKRLGEVVRTAPAFALTLRAYRRALLEGEDEIADGLLA